MVVGQGRKFRPPAVPLLRKYSCTADVYSCMIVSALRVESDRPRKTEGVGPLAETIRDSRRKAAHPACQTVSAPHRGKALREGRNSLHGIAHCTHRTGEVTGEWSPGRTLLTYTYT